MATEYTWLTKGGMRLVMSGSLAAVKKEIKELGGMRAGTLKKRAVPSKLPAPREPKKDWTFVIDDGSRTGIRLFMTSTYAKVLAEIEELGGLQAGTELQIVAKKK